MDYKGDHNYQTTKYKSIKHISLFNFLVMYTDMKYYSSNILNFVTSIEPY